MFKKNHVCEVKWETLSPFKRWFLIIFLGLGIGLFGYFMDSLDPTEITWWLFLGLFFFTSSNFFPLITKNYFVEIYIYGLGSAILAYFLGPLLAQLVGGDTLIGFLVISPLLIIALISDWKDWKWYKKFKRAEKE